MPHPDFQQLQPEGCKYTVVSTSHLADLQSEIELRREQGQFNSEFCREYMFRFKFNPPEELQNAKSLVVVAMPRPPKKATFTLKGKKQSFILPSIYTAYDKKKLNVESLVSQALERCGYRTAAPALPLKLLAARSGLIEYGKNNIAYAAGMGSFMRLTALYTNMPCQEDHWQEPKMMQQCQNCSLCQKACPTGAISPSRFLLHAEKCITYHNEKEGSIPFPDWIKPQWHNSVVGCVVCQRVCPVNKNFLSAIAEAVEFDEHETNLLLKGASPETEPSLADKIQRLALTDYYGMLPRNLSVLLEKAAKQGT